MSKQRGHREVKQYARHMLDQLERNSAKGDWKELSYEDRINEVSYHAAKLLIALIKQDPRGIAEYAADLGNEAMIAADVAGVLEKPTPKGKVLINEVMYGHSLDPDKEPPPPGESDLDPTLKADITAVVDQFVAGLANLVGYKPPVSNVH